jgi:uncharacterized membrane protein YoaK (UPF0700 family)
MWYRSARIRAESSYAAGILLLTTATGALDAVSYLGLDRVFTGNMTGNVLFIGFGLAGVDQIPVLNNVIALLSFLVGAGLGALATRRRGGVTALPLTSVWVLAANAAIVWAVSGTWLACDHIGEIGALATTGLLAMALGAQASAVSGIGIREYSTVVVTMTLVAFASESRLSGGTGTAQRRRAGVLLAMGVGAVVGALLWKFWGSPAALILAAVTMTFGCLEVAWARHLERQSNSEAAD